jgi:PP-loop superfamily ATP-utilizing enzyme
MRNKLKKLKALLLFSGGLDSILAAKILEKQGIEVVALTFVSYFFDAKQAKESAAENKISLIVRDISDLHLGIVRSPSFGRGAGMNPCIDCHLLMLKAAKKIAKEEGFDFLATGEVVGQRPMSQNQRALELIEKKANLEGKILRPLSALVLKETQMEKSGLIERQKMLGISGRGRKEQLSLAKKLGVENFPNPAGGCILTDKIYSEKLRELLEKVDKIKTSDLNLLRLGRHFWLGDARVILGRNHEENLALKKLAEKGDILVEPKNFPGPTALVRGKDKEAMRKAKEKILRYSKKAKDEKPDFFVSKI